MTVEITKQQIEALLGRSLTTVEDSNFDLYLGLAKTRVGDLICTNIDSLESIENDLLLVIARFFGALSKAQGYQGDVQSKRVEDFSVSYRDGYNPFEEAISQCRDILVKYSQCSSGIIHGKTIFTPCLTGDVHDEDAE